MQWAGTTIVDGLPVCGRRVWPKWVYYGSDDNWWWYDDEVDWDLS